MGFLTERDVTKTLFGYVYITTNKINGKQYIGRHKSTFFDESYKGSGKAIRSALKKYGNHNFRVEVLDMFLDTVAIVGRKNQKDKR